MNYEPAQIADVANAGSFICGIKRIIDTLDWNTGEWGTVYLVTLDAIDED